MNDKTYKVIELVGTSDQGIEKAIQNAIERASQTLDALAWFEITQVRGNVENGKVNAYQVMLKLGFLIKESGQ